MKKPASPDPTLVIDALEHAPDWKACGPTVRKIVLGSLDSADEKKPLQLAELPADFAQRFPQLTHLHLWNVKGLKSLPELPAGLQCLDVRSSICRQRWRPWCWRTARR